MAPKPEDVSSTPSESEVKPEVTSGFLKYPSQRDTILKHPDLWLKGKVVDDDVYPNWRVHNKVYDLTKFIKRHPGGKFWIQATQGMDITEAFESSHFGPSPIKILNTYYVREISKPRNSPFTFEPNGFYKTLKSRVTPILEKIGRGPTPEMLCIQDYLFYAFLACLLLASLLNSPFFSIVGGLFLCLAVIVSHNFFHQRDNWRMYIFDMSWLSSYEWRISHVLSHHIFPNTIYDYEISVFEPHLKMLAKENKGDLTYYRVIRNAFLVSILAPFIETITKICLFLTWRVSLHLPDAIIFIQLFIMSLLSGSFHQGLWLWLVLHISTSFFFLAIGLTAAHHHPEIFHEGDAYPTDKDWGVHQVVASRERGELFMESLLVGSVTFGNHTLHHLFPTVDQSKLHNLYPVFLETCKEFGVKFDLFTPWQLFKGFFDQLRLTKPNPNIPNCLTKTD